MSWKFSHILTDFLAHRLQKEKTRHALFKMKILFFFSYLFIHRFLFLLLLFLLFLVFNIIKHIYDVLLIFIIPTVYHIFALSFSVSVFGLHYSWFAAVSGFSLFFFSYKVLLFHACKSYYNWLAVMWNLRHVECNRASNMCCCSRTYLQGGWYVMQPTSGCYCL